MEYRKVNVTFIHILVYLKGKRIEMALWQNIKILLPIYMIFCHYFLGVIEQNNTLNSSNHIHI